MKSYYQHQHFLLHQLSHFPSSLFLPPVLQVSAEAEAEAEAAIDVAAYNRSLKNDYDTNGYHRKIAIDLLRSPAPTMLLLVLDLDAS